MAMEILSVMDHRLLKFCLLLSFAFCATLLAAPMMANAHVYGPRAKTTIAATQDAIVFSGLKCSHVSIIRDDLPGRTQGKARACKFGGRVRLDRGLHGYSVLCRILTHEFHHVDGWRAKKGEAYVKNGKTDWQHHRSKQSIMHPRPAMPRGCQR